MQSSLKIACQDINEESINLDPSMLLTCPFNYISDLVSDPLAPHCTNCMPHTELCYISKADKIMIPIRCQTNYFLSSFTNECLSECPLRTYANATTGICQSCAEHCVNCLNSPNNCIECENNYYRIQFFNMLYSSPCMTSCPESYYKIKSTQLLCFPCENTHCSLCDETGFCAICKIGFQQIKGTCVEINLEGIARNVYLTSNSFQNNIIPLKSYYPMTLSEQADKSLLPITIEFAFYINRTLFDNIDTEFGLIYFPPFYLSIHFTNFDSRTKSR